MTQDTFYDTKARVKEGDWKTGGSKLPFTGKYNVGRFTLSYKFMVQYMTLIHRFPVCIDDLKVNSSEDSIMYMEHYGIIDNSILLNMREMVKKPRNGFIILRERDVITGVYKENSYEKTY
ncbi:hypothetical protein AB6870_12555 [Rahnella inusitata]|uniref:hypothetical protein n=1 Tax=Rahnella inusitata TaxID=58169 RepID=UPI0039BDDB07